MTIKGAPREKMKGTIEVLELLVRQGWVPLRSMSTLLGYANATGIYNRQKSKHPITVVQVGGTKRVYADDAITSLMTVIEKKATDAQIIIDLYYTMQHKHIMDQTDKEQEDA